MLGFKSGPDWWLVAAGFLITTTIIPLLSLFGHAKLQGTLRDFGNKVSPRFSLIYCIIMYLIIIALPTPRTAAVTHEMAIAPLFGTSALWTSSLYFGLVFLFAINRSKALNLMGKYLTPIIVFMVLLIIVLGIASPPEVVLPATLKAPVVDGLIEGYQTYDAIAGMVMGGVIIISLNKNNYGTYAEKKKIIAQSGSIAMLGLFVIYTGLIALGAFYNTAFPESISRTDLLLGLSNKMLGNSGAAFIGVLVALACFTTAVAITVSIGDFFKALMPTNDKVYLYTTIICCVVGIVMGSYEVGFIIDIAIPALLFIYPISIVLILLHVLSDRWASPLVFRAVVFVTFVFSIPDCLKYIIGEAPLAPVNDLIPLAQYSLGWVLPALLVFVGVNTFTKTRPTSSR
jgi:LIVCS family branched-chain amino acid:cation transporter